ncbi:MAG TPA: energy transducer TonB, partial [Pyrinomonadaceae bacterium]|nr:energy transducer TonB [Pyrinomonadaceae bacterium]
TIASTGGVKPEFDKVSRQREELRAKLAAEEPTLTEYQVTERINKALAEAAYDEIVRMKSKLAAKTDAAVEQPVQIDPPMPPIRPSNGMDHGIRLTAKPRPKALGCEGPGGKSIAKVAFQNDGTIGEITWVEMSSCSIFNDSVMQAIREIKFEPEVKDGVAVTTTKQIEYVWANY